MQLAFCSRRTRTAEFDDGAEGEIDIKNTVSFIGVFEHLRDPAFFAGVRVDSEACTIVWPNGADLDPLVLHATALLQDDRGARIPGNPVPEFSEPTLARVLILDDRPEKVRRNFGNHLRL
jgi:hypothetical protein